MTKAELLQRLALVNDDAIIVGANRKEITGVAIDTGQPAVLAILSSGPDVQTRWPDVTRGLQVLLLTPHIVRYLDDNDPKALEQAQKALRLATGVCGAQGGYGVTCNRPAGHDGPHGDVHETWTDDQPCGRPIDAAVVAPCEKPAGHTGPCRAFSLEK